MANQAELIKVSLPPLPRLRPPKVKASHEVDIYQLIPKGKPALFWLCNKHCETVLCLHLGQRNSVEKIKKLLIPFPAGLGQGNGTLIEGALTKQCGPNSIHFYRVINHKGRACNDVPMRQNLEVLLSVVEELVGSHQYKINIPYTLTRPQSLQFSEMIAKYKLYGIRGIALDKLKIEWQSSLSDTLKALAPRPDHEVFLVTRTDMPDVYNINELWTENTIQTSAVQSLNSSTTLNKLFRFGTENTSSSWIEDSDDEESVSFSMESLVMLCKKITHSKWEPIGLA